MTFNEKYSQTPVNRHIYRGIVFKLLQEGQYEFKDKVAHLRHMDAPHDGTTKKGWYLGGAVQRHYL
ncbi:hypothetical protein GCM10028826_17990 [Mucilaginibacter boryungensis]